MKTSAIVCAVLAGTFGISSVASAQQWGERGERGQHRAEQRQEQREARHDGRHDDRGARQAWSGGYRQPQYSYSQPRYPYSQPRQQYRQPHYVYSQPAYRSAHRYDRGTVLPFQYRTQPYHVSNWQAYPGLYAPAYGQQWVNVDGEFLLVALATGLIANALLN